MCDQILHCAHGLFQFETRTEFQKFCNVFDKSKAMKLQLQQLDTYKWASYHLVERMAFVFVVVFVKTVDVSCAERVGAL